MFAHSLLEKDIQSKNIIKGNRYTYMYTNNTKIRNAEKSEIHQ